MDFLRKFSRISFQKSDSIYQCFSNLFHGLLKIFFLNFIQKFFQRISTKSSKNLHWISSEYLSQILQDITSYENSLRKSTDIFRKSKVQNFSRNCSKGFSRRYSTDSFRNFSEVSKTKFFQVFFWKYFWRFLRKFFLLRFLSKFVHGLY